MVSWVSFVCLPFSLIPWLYWTVRYSKLRFYWLILMMRLVLIVYRRKFSKKTYIAKTTMALKKRVWTKCLKSRAKLYQTQVSKRRAKILHHRCTMSLRRNLRIQYRIQNAGNYEESSMEAEAKSEILQGNRAQQTQKIPYESLYGHFRCLNRRYRWTGT